MTYYLITGEDLFYNSESVSYLWTNKKVYVDLFYEEYEFYKETTIVEVYENVKSTFEFFDLIIEEHGVTLNDYNELYLMVSDNDPSVYHITTPSIQEDLSEGGMTDAQYESTVHSIIRSVLNLNIMSKYVKDPLFTEYLQKSILKYISQFVLLKDGVIPDTFNEGKSNMYALRYMGITSLEDVKYQEGIFAILDYVMFTKICEGMEL